MSEYITNNAETDQLALLAESLSRHTYPGYPSQFERFSCDAYQAQLLAAGTNDLPPGVWDTDFDRSPNNAEINDFITKGLTVDSKGRPLHPWLQNMATDTSVGIIGNKGAYWFWGPNYTADAITVCQDHVLLIQRSDTGLWALPGGHLNANEDPMTAALRELQEETGLAVPAATDAKLTYKGPVVDLRATAHAWPETSAYLIELPGQLPSVQGLDDARAAGWFTIDEVLNAGKLYGAHNYLLRQAIT